MIPVKSAFLFALLTSVVLFGAHCTAEAQANSISIDLNAAPLRTALTRLQDASGLHLAFAADLVRDAEPVTLSAKDEPVDAVLLRILRPRGLECIYTGETMAAIVRADSNMGMAKAAGRAMRTFARLEKKLENAVQVGDEVKVPGWVEEDDDRELAEAAVDFAAALRYFGLREGLVGKLDAVPGMLGSTDVDARTGACVPAVIFTHVGNEMPFEESEAIAEILQKALADRDPAVRGSGLLTVASLNTFGSQLWPAIRQKVMAAGVKDPAPEVRFATALAAGIDRRNDPDAAILGSLRSDANAAVRAAACFYWSSRRRKIDGDEQVEQSFTGALAGDANPILQALGVFMLRSTWRDDAARLGQLAASPAAANDSWLKLSADLLAAFCNADRFDPAADNGTAATAGAGPSALDRAAVLDRLAGMLASGKPSHQALAAGVLLQGMHWFEEGASGRADFSKLAELAGSDCLWARLAGIVAGGACPGAASEAQVLQALYSQDELERLAALEACSVQRRNDREGAARPANAPAFRQALATALRSPRYAVRAAAAVAIVRTLPFDDAMAILQDDIRRDPRGAGAEAMLAAFGKLADDDHELNEQRRMMVLDALLESKNDELQSLVLKNTFWFASQPLLLTMICESEPEAFYELTANDNLSNQLKRYDFAIRAILDRYAALFEKRAAGDFAAVRGFASYIGNIEGVFFRFGGNPEFTKGIVELVDKMASTCTGPGASDAAVGAGVDLLCAYFGLQAFDDRRAILSKTPAGIRTAAARAMAYADHPRIGAKIAVLLGDLYQAPYWFQKDAEVSAAMEDARRKIMTGNRADDQAVLLTGMIMLQGFPTPWLPKTAEDESADAYVADALVELQKRMIAGAVPERLRGLALWAIEFQSREISAEFEQYLMERLADPAEGIGFNSKALPVLARHGSPHYEVLGNILADWPKGPDADTGFENALTFWTGRVQIELRKLRTQGKPMPDWARKAADVGLAAACDPMREGSARREALGLYAAAAGAEAAAQLEALAQDDRQDVAVRSAAVEFDLQVNPETKLLATLAEKYPTLPKYLREALGQHAARAPKAAGAEALFILYLKDRELGEQRRWRFFFTLSLPPTPTLMAALKELEHDPEIGDDVQKAIKRLEEKK
ncbi:MAG TPA: hypothetical protein VM186_05065 [Planctomycetota bacterium]|nr:hypothetical protein [Planctomycetota bacterium]